MDKNLILAGGLGKRDIADAVTQIGPATENLSSSVEMFHGVKDVDKIKAPLAALAP